ncbi:MAG: hypothetical protein AB7E36_07260 [Salinivirgaceae bacterium]
MLKFNLLIGILLALSVFASKAKAQESCILKLNEAEKLYDEGKIERIPELLNSCIDAGFNKENKIAALKLLTLVYLFEDNQTKAENTLLKLLKTDPEFKINRAIDPVEFIRLYDSYNTSPVFSIGLTGGTSLSNPQLFETFTTYEFDKAATQYMNDGLGFLIGIKVSYHISSKFDLSFEPGIASYNFKVRENTGDALQTTISESLTLIDFPINGAYDVYKYKQFDFFAELGFNYGMYLTGSLGGTLSYANNEKPDYEAPAISSELIRSPHLMQAMLGVGTKMKLNRSNLQFNIQYRFGLNNLTTTENRSSFYETSMKEYMYLDNNFTNNSLVFKVSYNFEFYLHRKKPNNKTNFDVIN